jgi:hypothetical protein
VTSYPGLTRVLDGTRPTLPADDFQNMGMHVHGDSSKVVHAAEPRARKALTTNSGWSYVRAVKGSSIARPGTTAGFAFVRNGCMVTSSRVGVERPGIITHTGVGAPMNYARPRVTGIRG